MRYASDPNRTRTRPAALPAAARGRVYTSSTARRARRQAARDRRAWLVWWVVVIALLAAAVMVLFGLFHLAPRWAVAGTTVAAAALALAWRELL